MLNSYPSIYNLGHAALADLLKGLVIVEEKIDGSQFSFGKNEAGELFCRSKGTQINMIAPEGLFSKAVATVNELAPLLRPGFTYRGEYLAKPKHNCLAYDRVPNKHVIIFDISTGLEQYASPIAKRSFANELGLEVVPTLFEGEITDVNHFRTFLDRESVLGGQKIEGVVIKPALYDLFGRDKKVLLGKFVSEAFREIHANDWKKDHAPKSTADIIGILAAKYSTPARWNKAVIHLLEAGVLENSPKDIGHLIKEVPEDVLKECAADIAQELMDWAWPQLRRKLTHGLPEWYKEELLKKQFAQ